MPMPPLTHHALPPLTAPTLPAKAPAALKDGNSSGSDTEGSETGTSKSVASVGNHMPSGLILKSGRVRLPDRLMEYLNNDVAPEALFWMPEGESFAIDTEKASEQILNRYFSGTKVSSFLRSISRWGFKRVFYHELDKHIYAFHHPLFKKEAPHLEREMKMIVSTPSESKKAKKSKKRAGAHTEATRVPVGSSSPVVLPQERATVQSAALIAARAATGPVESASNLLLPASATLAAPADGNHPQLLSLLQMSMQQGQQSQPGLMGSLVQQQQQPDPAAQQLAQLLALRGSTAGEGAGVPQALQDSILRLAVARQIQQQQQQQRQQHQAVLDLLNALQNNNNTQG